MRRWIDALQDDRVLSAEARRLMLQRHVRDSAGSFSGYGWFLSTPPRRTSLATHDGSLSGYFTADLHWYADEGIAVFVPSNSVEHRAQEISTALTRILPLTESTPVVLVRLQGSGCAGDAPAAQNRCHGRCWI